MKYAYTNGVLLDGSADMQPQRGMVLRTDGELSLIHIFHRKAHAAGRKFAGRVGKLRIAQSVAERIFDALMRAFIIPVADDQPLSLIHI